MKKTASSTRSRSRKPVLDVEPRSRSLVGHTAIVTGSSKGLGKAMAIALGDAGAKVVINYYNGKEQAERALDEVRSRGIDAAMIRADAAPIPRLAPQMRAVLPERAFEASAASLPSRFMTLREHYWS